MHAFALGLDRLVRGDAALPAAGRVGLLCHAAGVTSAGEHGAVALRRLLGSRLAALFGPEHGVRGRAGAGEPVADGRHPDWDIPVYSLYGDTRRPTAEMLDAVDILVCDLQDLGVRCYTYGSTLKLVLEAAAAAGKEVVVLDRPIPFPRTLDGPLLDPALESFVGCLPGPLVYGLTPGETARWLHEAPGLRETLRLTVIGMTGYARQPAGVAGAGAWVPPSPAIVSRESAWCYPATVFTEALPALDCGRRGPAPFQTLAAPWLDGDALCRRLRDAALPGVAFAPVAYTARGGPADGETVRGISLAVTDPARFLPVTTGFHLLAAVRDTGGADRLWQDPTARPAFFDSLCGSALPRRALQGAASLDALWRQLDRDRARFADTHARVRLYAPGP
jgi:uncharacterized protein YbbC (DUF1343 family)